MKKKKGLVITVMLVMVLAFTVLTACGNSKKNQEISITITNNMDDESLIAIYLYDANLKGAVSIEEDDVLGGTLEVGETRSVTFNLTDYVSDDMEDCNFLFQSVASSSSSGSSNTSQVTVTKEELGTGGTFTINEKRDIEFVPKNGAKSTEASELTDTQQTEDEGEQSSENVSEESSEESSEEDLTNAAIVPELDNAHKEEVLRTYQEYMNANGYKKCKLIGVDNSDVPVCLFDDFYVAVYYGGEIDITPEAYEIRYEATGLFTLSKGNDYSYYIIENGKFKELYSFNSEEDVYTIDGVVQGQDFNGGDVIEPYKDKQERRTLAKSNELQWHKTLEEAYEHRNEDFNIYQY